jgi:hypothetical protein
MIHFLHKIVGYFLVFIHFSGIKKFIDTVYRNIWHKKYKKIKLFKNLTPAEAQGYVDRLAWQKDGIKEFFDSIGEPGWFQFCLDEVLAGKQQPRGALDCDDFAIWCCNVLDEKYKPLLFSQIWAYKNRKNKKTLNFSGHSVCVFVMPGRFGVHKKYYHIGNWGLAGPFYTLKELSKDMCREVNATPINWCLYDKNLKLKNSSINF